MLCTLNRNTVGALCGYVRVPRKLAKSFRWKKFERKARYRFDVHGGVTFAGKHCNEPKLEDGKWIGFDCAHYQDYLPDYANYSFAMLNMDHTTYRDVAYVKEQRALLAQQIAREAK